jgi:hypothetical protein
MAVINQYVVMPADATALNGMVTTLITLISCVLFQYSLPKAAKLNPIDAIRHL